MRRNALAVSGVKDILSRVRLITVISIRSMAFKIADAAIVGNATEDIEINIDLADLSAPWAGREKPLGRYKTKSINVAIISPIVTPIIAAADVYSTLSDD